MTENEDKKASQTKALEDLAQAMNALVYVWDEKFDDGYPFHESFDELAHRTGNWVDDVKKRL